MSDLLEMLAQYLWGASGEPRNPLWRTILLTLAAALWAGVIVLIAREVF